MEIEKVGKLTTYVNSNKDYTPCKQCQECCALMLPDWESRILYILEAAVPEFDIHLEFKKQLNIRIGVQEIAMKNALQTRETSYQEIYNEVFHPFHQSAPSG